MLIFKLGVLHHLDKIQIKKRETPPKAFRKRHPFRQKKLSSGSYWTAFFIYK